MLLTYDLNLFSIISLVLAGYSILSLQARLREQQSKHVDLRYGYSVYDADESFHTQFSFYNLGTIPATGVKIRLTYPSGTKIQRIIPSLKKTESEDNLEKLVELDILRLDINKPLAVLVTSSDAPKGPPEIQCHEQKSVQTVARASIGPGPQ